MKNLIGLCFLLSILFFTAIPLVDAADFSLIKARELKQRIDSDEETFLLNPLSTIEYNEGYIPGSVNIPLNTIPKTNLLPADPETLIVTYCLGLK
jgi:rhodanese-related sulfurtransferase